MPTFFVESRFWNDYGRLSPGERAQFIQARDEFIQILLEWEQSGKSGVPKFPRSLGVTPMVNQRQIMEFAWGPNGRCTWRYGVPQRPDKFHVIWRRIGKHDIYRDP